MSFLFLHPCLTRCLVLSQIRSAVHRGDVMAAVELVNDLNPETLDTNSKLYFHLCLQHFIELMRKNRVRQTLQR